MPTNQQDLPFLDVNPSSRTWTCYLSLFVQSSFSRLPFFFLGYKPRVSAALLAGSLLQLIAISYWLLSGRNPSLTSPKESTHPFFCFPHAKLFMRSAFLRQLFSISKCNCQQFVDAPCVHWLFAPVPQLSGCSSTATSNMTITTAGVPSVVFKLLGSLKPPSRIQVTWTSTARSVWGHSFNGLRMELPSEC